MGLRVRVCEYGVAMTKSANVLRRAGAILAALILAALAGSGLAVLSVLPLAGPAQAAVPDHWGFAFVDHPAVAGITDPNHQAGSWPLGPMVTSTPGVPGEALVRFPLIASSAGVVHVTAVMDIAVWCQAESWAPSGPDEVVAVRCYRPGGAPVFAPFVVTFTQSSVTVLPPAQAYGYVHFQPPSAVVTSYNSAAAANTVTPTGVGAWTVTMAGLGPSTRAGNVQVTAVNPATPAKCELQAWAPASTGQRFTVRCFDATTNPLSTGWTLTYHLARSVLGTQPAFFGYTFDNQPATAGPYAPVPPQVNFNSAGAVNTLLRAGTGLRLVSFPAIGQLPNTVLVTGVKVGSGLCNLNTLWATSPPNVTVRDVTCYTASGVFVNRQAMITYAAKS
jgi:hypothetical protein